ncbi:hypothetical protein GAU_1575 [Gemmatimonas aurantiaca T-27]|uniref:DUF5683 domain-containing protein n=2 Tax=Gemmatimonas aurantiaca TaxID=173480 RepID=C1A8Q7_GEMAT|nr:hypothetical protein GAU_1575 [Gemmatimonas aurantiaca T-27]
MFLQLPTSAAEAQIAPAGAGVPASIHAGVHPVALTAQAHHTGQVARAEQAPIEDAQGSALRSLLTVAQPPAKQAPWWAPIASGVVPGAGQFVLKQQRSAAYAVAEAYLLIQYLGSRRDGNRERDNYRQLAADVARRQFGGSLPVGPWKYYETMESYLESGVYNRTPGQALTPEMDETTYNGNRWRLARDTYWRDPNVEPARSSAEYQRAIEFYEQNAIHDAYRWSWRDARLEQDTYREVIDNANRSYQRGVNYAGVLVANHLASLIDAYVSVRLRRFGGAGLGGVQIQKMETRYEPLGDPLLGQGQWRAGLQLGRAPR